MEKGKNILLKKEGWKKIKGKHHDRYDPEIESENSPKEGKDRKNKSGKIRQL